MAKLAAAMLGTSTLVNGLACVPTAPATLQVQVSPGEIYSLQNLDGTAYSSLAADTTHQILKQGLLMDAATLNCPAPTTSGYSINYLIEATYQDVDGNAVVLPYYNASNPSQAYSGPANSGTAQNTTRKGVCMVQVKAGVAATTGTQQTPAADSGYVGLWVVTVAYGQTQITAANIAQAANAPFLPSGGIVPSVQNNAFNYALDTGTANTYQVSYNPPVTQLTDGMILSFRAKTANTGASTFSPNGLASKPIYAQGHAALLGGEIVVNGFVEVEWNSALNGWVLCENSGGLLPQNIIQRGVQQFTANGSFTVPAGVTKLWVSLVGGGGGGAGSINGAAYTAGGGGSGGVQYRVPVTVTPGQVVAVTIGSGGAGGIGSGSGGTYANSNGASGGASTFGALLTASGGAGGNCQAGQAYGGAPGSSSFAAKGESGTTNGVTADRAGAGGGNIFGPPNFTITA
ncbi:glycine-rich domain-containing protein [Ralstonia syzygii subsp. celebesensis]